jgi:hypothetical protein
VQEERMRVLSNGIFSKSRRDQGAAKRAQAAGALMGAAASYSGHQDTIKKKSDSPGFSGETPSR